MKKFCFIILFILITQMFLIADEPKIFFIDNMFENTPNLAIREPSSDFILINVININTLKQKTVLIWNPPPANKPHYLFYDNLNDDIFKIKKDILNIDMQLNTLDMFIFKTKKRRKKNEPQKFYLHQWR